MHHVVIEINNIKLTLELKDTPTAKKVFEQLPFAGTAQLWGDEIYFDIPLLDIALEADAKEVVEIGDVGFWVAGSAIAIFFGPTPLSHNDEPRAAEPINVFGKIIGSTDELHDVKEGEFIYMTAGTV